MGIVDTISKITRLLPKEVALVAVSKTKPESAILEAYEGGQRIFGENKVQDLVRKYESLPKDIRWHFIGHLQTNKVKYIAPFISLIHAVDSMKLLMTIDKEAAKNNRTIDCLLQFYIAKEDSKFGLSYDEAVDMLQSKDFLSLKNVRIVGVMGMASFSDDSNLVRSEFSELRAIFNKLKSQFFDHKAYFKEISMGMSQDYLLALEEGTTMIRLGTSIFGYRDYTV